MEDPKLPVIDLLTRNISVKKDDGTTPATILVTSKWYDDKTMDGVDGIITVGMIDDMMMPSGCGYVGGEDHVYIVEVNVWTISKFDSGGNQIVTDEIMRWKLVQQVSSIIRANWRDPTYGSPPQPSGIHTMRIRVFRDLDDPQKTPYPLRRTQMEIETFFLRNTLAV